MSSSLIDILPKEEDTLLGKLKQEEKDSELKKKLSEGLFHQEMFRVLTEKTFKGQFGKKAYDRCVKRVMDVEPGMLK